MSKQRRRRTSETYSSRGRGSKTRFFAAIMAFLLIAALVLSLVLSVAVGGGGSSP